MSAGGFDSFTETTRVGFFKRLGDSIKGIVFGLILFVLSFPVLFWNEGRAVETYLALREGEGAVVSVPAEELVPDNEGKLVHVAGLATTEEVLKDGDFGVQAKALRLRRQVEIYQWEEKKETKRRKRLGGGEEQVTEYKYHKVWSSSPINSSNFHHRTDHENVGQLDYPSRTQTASKITLGAYTLSSSQGEQISKFQPVPSDNIDLNKARDSVRTKPWTLTGNGFYKGSNPSDPAIGDQRVQFSMVLPLDISVFAQQTGKTFQPYQTKAGQSLSRLEIGRHSAQEMFQHAHSENTILTWVMRLVGYLMMTFGLFLLVRPLVVVADVIPFLGDLLRMGLGLVAALIAAPLTLITIAIGWIYYRPLLAGCLLGGAAVCVGVLFYLRRGRTKGAPTPA